MKALRKMLVVLVACVYTLQAMAAVAHAAGCADGEGHGLHAAHVVHGEPAGAGAQHHDHDHDAAVAADDDDCDHCASCKHQGCACGDHGCSSAAGITPDRFLHEVYAQGAFHASPAVLSPRQPWVQGLIRPPSRS